MGAVMSKMSERDIEISRELKENQSWTWVPPSDTAALLERLAIARDLDVPARERENLCSVARNEIARLAQRVVALELTNERLRTSWVEDVARERGLKDAEIKRFQRLVEERENLLYEFLDDVAYRRDSKESDYPFCTQCGSTKANPHNPGCLVGNAEALLRHTEA